MLKGEVSLEGSKSLSNRLLFMEALCGRKDFPFVNMSPSEDTKIMRDLLSSAERILDAGDCGTAFRFMTAWLAWKGESRILTGSTRMLQRPVGPLVEALRGLGFEVKYLGEEGFPPLEFGSGKWDASQKDWEVSQKDLEVRADISSQFVSALCLLGPVLPRGLDLVLKGTLRSAPYIEMTLGVLTLYGVVATYYKEEQRIRVSPGPLISTPPSTVESDWSAAAFYFAMMAHAEQGSEICLKGLNPSSLQGDARIVRWAPLWGVGAFWQGENLYLRKVRTEFSEEKDSVLDFTDCPDLAQPVMVALSATGKSWRLKGLESLQWKETNRLEAMRRELAKVGINLNERENGEWELSGSLRIEEGCFFETYGDHRMALSMSAFALCATVEIEDPKVVRKSYTGFWEDLERLGFSVA